MPDIYDIDFNSQAYSLTPPDKRLPKTLGWLGAFMFVLQLMRDRFFTDYADGNTSPFWVSAATYALGDETIAPDNGVYELITPGGITGITTPPNQDAVNWVKIQDVYIGLRERLKYNSRKIVLEFILNKWFRVAVLPAPQIYIQNNDFYGSVFLLGGSGPTSSSMALLSNSQAYFLGNVYTYNTNSFTIYVPTAIFAALDPDPTNAENIIRAIADKYVIAGMLYNVVTY